MRPVDRDTTDQGMAHFIPTEFHAAAADLIGMPAKGVERPVVCSEPLVETTVVESGHGALIPLVNWSGGPVKGLKVVVGMDVPAGSAKLAGGGRVRVSTRDTKRVFVLDLDIADALILR